MIANLNELVEEEGQQDFFRYIAIDSQSDDLEKEAPQRANLTAVGLDKPTDFFETHRQEYFYLKEDYELEGPEGTGKTRPIARYHMDNINFTDIQDRILRDINDFKQEMEDRGIADSGDMYPVWIINSLGGGTGSGLFPLLAALLKQELSENEFQINGAGSLPRVDRFGTRAPAKHNQLYANAYTALEELQALVGEYAFENDGANHRNLIEAPPQVRVESGELVSSGDRIPINELDSLFDYYWLLGYREDEPFDNYREQLNQVVSNAIYYLSVKDEPEDFPYSDAGDDEVLMALSSAELSIPKRRAREYIENRDEIKETKREIDAINDDLDNINNEMEYLREIDDQDISLDDRGDSEEFASEVDRIPPQLLSNSLNLASRDYDPLVAEVEVRGNRADREHMEEILENILDEKVDELGVHLDDPSEWSKLDEEASFEKRKLIEKFCCQVIIETVEENIVGHEFEELVEDAWADYDDRLIGDPDIRSDEFERISNGKPKEMWTDILDDWLLEFAQQKETEAREKFGPRPIRRKAAREARETHEEIEPEFHQYERLETLQQLAEARVEIANNHIRDRLDALEGLKHSKKNELNEKEKSVRRLERRQEKKRERLEDGRRRRGRYYLPMYNLEDLSYDDIYRTVNLGKLVEEKVITDEREIPPELIEKHSDIAFDEDGGVDRNEPENWPLNDISVDIYRLENEWELIDEGDYSEITENMIEQRPSIEKLENLEIIQESDVGTYLEDLINSPFLQDDPVHDLRVSGNAKVEEKPEVIVGPMVSEDNRSLLEREGAEGEYDIPGAINGIGENMSSRDIEAAVIQSGLTVKFVAWYTPATLANMSEYGSMYEYYIDPEKNVESHLQTINDGNVTDSFAYPELVHDRKIRELLSDSGRPVDGEEE